MEHPHLLDIQEGGRGMGVRMVERLQGIIRLRVDSRCM
jgi:hypothetical protein